MLKNLTESDRKRIQTAIDTVGDRTDGNFSLVVVPVSDGYALYPIAWGAVAALLSAALLIFIRPELDLAQAFLIQAVIFVVISVLFEWRPLRLLLVPTKIKQTEARELAHSEFAALTLADHNRRIDVLFFVSLGERYVEIIAEHELHERVGEAAWKDIVAEFVAAAKAGGITDGFVTAVAACGTLLETYKPKK